MNDQISKVHTKIQQQQHFKQLQGTEFRDAREYRYDLLFAAGEENRNTDRTAP